MANYYRRFIKGYSGILAPLSDLVRKEATWSWGAPQETAFNELKKRMTEAPILRIFDYDRPAILETDASDYALGATLLQEHDGKRCPVAYHSRKFTKPELNYDVHDKELLAIVEALHHWKVYLQGTDYAIPIYSDHLNLTYWKSTKVLNRRQVRWAETLAGFNFRIIHVKGTENGRADALSRRPDYAQNMPKVEQTMLVEKDGYLTYNQPSLATIEGMPHST